MKINRAALVRLINDTTFVPLFVGLCALLVGLGIGDQPFWREVAGYFGAFIVALTCFRRNRDVSLAEDGARRVSNTP